MAKRKKHHKKTTHRRRVGALHAGGIMDAVVHLLAVAGGVLAGRYVNGNLVATMDAKLVGAAETAVGAFAVAKVKNTKIKAVGLGFGANGAMYALGSKGLAVLPAAFGYGPDETALYSPSGMAGYRQVPKIGYPKPANIGYPKPANIGAADRERQRTARMYAGVYN